MVLVVLITGIGQRQGNEKQIHQGIIERDMAQNEANHTVIYLNKARIQRQGIQLNNTINK